MDLSVVVPCFNEAENTPLIEAALLPVLRGLSLPGGFEVLLIDDGSTDGTAAQLSVLTERNPEARLVLHENNAGLGAALRSGFRQARGSIVVTVDSDASYRFSDIPALLEMLTEDVDIVTASPYHPAGSIGEVSKLRLWLSRCCSVLYRRILASDIYTFTSLFRAYRREVLESVPFDAPGYLAGTEILVRAILRGFRVAELPCRLQPRQYGTSKIRLMQTVCAHVGMQSRLLKNRDAFRGP